MLLVFYRNVRESLEGGETHRISARKTTKGGKSMKPGLKFCEGCQKWLAPNHLARTYRKFSHYFTMLRELYSVWIIAGFVKQKRIVHVKELENTNWG